MGFEKIQSPQQENVCPHGNDIAQCPQCVWERRVENQPALKAAEALTQKSRFRRSSLESPNCELEIGEKKYSVELIERRDHPDLAQVQNLLVDTFSEAEVDPEEILRAAVEGKTPWGIGDLPYRVYAIKDAEGKAVSMLSGGLLEMRDREGNDSGESMFMVGYAVTDKNARQGGLAREAYISALIGAAADAEAQGRKFAFAAGECTYTSERFWNNVGWKRVYAADAPGETKSYGELKYIQPAVDFDEETGEPTEGAGEAPEHLMIDSFNRMPPTKEQIAQTVEAFYLWCNKWPREAFATDAAYENCMRYVEGFEQKFRKELEDAGQIIFLDQPSREKALQKGISIREYEEADHKEESGEEDF